MPAAALKPSFPRKRESGLSCNQPKMNGTNPL